MEASETGTSEHWFSINWIIDTTGSALIFQARTRRVITMIPIS